MNSTDTSRCVYVVVYDSKINEGQKLYLRTSPKRSSVTDIQQARRFSSLKNAQIEAKKLKFGNPRIERHVTLLAEKEMTVLDCNGQEIS